MICPQLTGLPDLLSLWQETINLWEVILFQTIYLRLSGFSDS
jgi:hypothetical protein